MTSETIVAMVVVLIGILPILIIGIVQFRSKNPVGFWSGKEPPRAEQITDVKAYNRRHGLMWILYGAGFVLCFGCGYFAGERFTAILCIVEGIGGMLAMIAYHNRLNRKYFRKEGEK